MSNSNRESITELQRSVVVDMRENRIEEPASMEEIIRGTDIDNRDEAKDVLRRLINDGKISTTPEWEYRLASRLRR